MGKLLEEIAPPRVIKDMSGKPAEGATKLGPSPEVIERIKKAIAEAETIEEVTRLEKALKSGILPDELKDEEPEKPVEKPAEKKKEESKPEPRKDEEKKEAGEKKAEDVDAMKVDG